MAFVNLSLLVGGVLTVIPVVLHLVLRQQPKRVLFPALRFLKERHESNRRELHLRHWLLLLLRCALIAIGALAFARPSVASAVLGNWLIVSVLVGLTGFAALLAVVAGFRKLGKWLIGGLAFVAAGLFCASVVLAIGTLTRGTSVVTGDQQAPIAAAVVVDTSPRMAYRFHNQTRLELAQETGLWLLKQFPADSAVAVLESRPAPPFFAVDFAAAKSMLERLRITGVPDVLPDVVGKGIELVAASENARREVYVFTDLTQAAWPDDASQRLKSQLEQHPEVSLYIIDVGAAQPRNVSLGELQLSGQTLVKSSELVLATDVVSEGFSGDVSAEFLIEQPDPTRPILVDGKPLLPVAHVRDRRTVSLTAGAAQRVEFRVRGWESGTQQGILRLTMDDGLPQDNIRYFAVEVRDAWPILLVAPPQVNTTLMLETLAPFEQRESGTARFDCQEIAQGDLANHNLAAHAVVCLLNPQRLPPAQWEQLGEYVDQGGNLAIFLGHNAQGSKSFNEPAAQRLLGGKLLRVWRASERELFLSPQRFDHPAVAIFREQSSSVPWQELPVFFHWVMEEGENGSTIVPYSNGKPALLERQIGKGRVLIATTPWSEESRPVGRSTWNELLTGENAWPSFVIINELMRYLVSGGESRLNYHTGETATVVNEPGRDPDRYQLFPPSEDPQEVVSRAGRLSIAFTEQPGAYRLKGQHGGPVVRGFAVNLPPDTSRLTRWPREKFDELLGPGRFRFARNRDEIVLEVGEARAGREFYPYLLIIFAVVFGLEQALANRFYRTSTDQKDKQTATTRA